MRELIDKITNKNLTEAEKSLREELASIMEVKLKEKKKKMMAGDTPFKSPGEMGQIKAKRKSLRGVTKVLKDIKEAIVHKDGLVHLATGEKVLKSVYNARRWLSEGAEGKGEFADDIRDHLDHENPEVRKHAKQAMDALNDNEVESAQEHLNMAKKAARKKIEEDTKADDKHFEKQDTKKQNKLNALLRQGKSYAEAKKKIKLKEDCGLDPDKEKKVEAAREMAKMILQPQLDTTAPRIDRTVVCIPKGTRPADRLTAPDLGPKEDEWMHGKKLDEGMGSLKNIKQSAKAAAEKASQEQKAKAKKLKEEFLDEMARKVSDAATKAFLAKKTFKSKNTKSTGDELHLHGNKIAYHKDGKIHATLAGWPTTTTKERLNSLSKAVGGKRFSTNRGKHYYGDKEIKSDEHVELT